MVVGGWWGLHSHYIVKPNLVLRLGWGFDKNIWTILKIEFQHFVNTIIVCVRKGPTSLITLEID